MCDSAFDSEDVELVLNMLAQGAMTIVERLEVCPEHGEALVDVGLCAAQQMIPEGLITGLCYCLIAESAKAACGNAIYSLHTFGLLGGFTKKEAIAAAISVGRGSANDMVRYARIPHLRFQGGE